MKSWETPAGNGVRRLIAVDKALDAACRQLTLTCPDKCPIIYRACFNSVPTRKACAQRMKAYLLRRAR